MKPSTDARTQGRHTKADARYTPQGTRAEHCGICRHFIQPGRCEVIEGKVVAGGWCRFFSKVGRAGK